MKVEYAPAIQADRVVFEQAQQATEILEQEAGGSLFWDTTSASWIRESHINQQVGLFQYHRDSTLLLELSNGMARADGAFVASKMTDREYTLDRMRRLWGDLLQAISHDQLKSRHNLSTSGSKPDGDEALELILDRVADYSEREGHGPDSLKLPIRYATALIKLGPAYWGDLYPQIRESGLKAFDGQTLFGMRVELVPGVDAELQVA